MPVGSHKDAFKAHQMVKKLVTKQTNPSLAQKAAEILLDFVKSSRQVSSENVINPTPGFELFPLIVIAILGYVYNRRFKN